MAEQSVNFDSWEQGVPAVIYTTPDGGFELWQDNVPVLQIGVNPSPQDTTQRRRAFEF